MTEAEPRWSAACERNKGPILARLRTLFEHSHRVLEIGSGTGQHAVHFAAAMPDLQWLCTDRAQNLPALAVRLAAEQPGNVDGPLPLDVREAWPDVSFDAAFSANTAHIMAIDAVERMFGCIAHHLPAGGRFALYGPFHYGGVPTSDGNAAFDRELCNRGNGEGIRDIESIVALAASNGLLLLADMAMPANNRLLAWEKTE